jgi:hypothetical protein
MIAADSESPLEVAVKMIAAPVWVPVYFAYVGCCKAVEVWSRRKPKPVEPEILTPVQPTWIAAKRSVKASCGNEFPPSRNLAVDMQNRIALKPVVLLRTARTF